VPDVTESVVGQFPISANQMSPSGGDSFGFKRREPPGGAAPRVSASFIGFVRSTIEACRARRMEEPFVQTETAFGVIGGVRICISLDSEGF
jgi:hypothetical protein